MSSRRNPNNGRTPVHKAATEVPTPSNINKTTKSQVTRRDLKRKVISLQTMLRAKDITAEERMELSKQLLSIRNDLNAMVTKSTSSTSTDGKPQQLHETEITKDEIASRRQFLAENPGLRDTFRAIWMVFVPYTENGILSKDGYLKFQQVIHVALIGPSNHVLEDVSANIDRELAHDNILFGPLNEQAFYDLMFETLETWSEIIDPYYYAAFAWTLLDSIANTNEHPPKIRPFREIKCITKIENEASMIKHYLSGKKVRAALAIEAEMLSRVPDVQKRLHARKKGADLDQGQQDMINALTVSLGLQRQTAAAADQNDSDSEDISVAESVNHKQDIAQESSDIELPNTDLKSSGGEVVDAALEADSFSSTSSVSGEFVEVTRPIQRRSNYLMRTNTQSFMNYVQARRSSKMVINGGYVFNSSSRFGGNGFSISELSDDQNEEMQQKLRNFSFAQFVSSGVPFDEFKKQQRGDGESYSSGQLHFDKRQPTKFEISSHNPNGGVDSDDNSVSSKFSFFGNKDAKLSVNATTFSPNNQRKDNARRSMRNSTINPTLLNSSYLLKIEHDDVSVASSTSSGRKPIALIGNKPQSSEFQKNLRDTQKYGIGKRTETVVLDASLFADKLAKINDSKDHRPSDDSAVTVDASKKSNLVFTDEESLQSSNTNIAVKTFAHSTHIEPSQGKSFHDPLNPQLVEAFFSAHEMKEAALKKSFERNQSIIVSNLQTQSSLFSEESNRMESPIRNRFMSLIDGDTLTRPVSAELVSTYSNSAWDVSRAMHGVKMDNTKKLKLLETMQQATVASLLESGSQTSSNSLVNIHGVKRASSTSSNNSPNANKKSLALSSPRPSITNDGCTREQVDAALLPVDDDNLKNSEHFLPDMTTESRDIIGTISPVGEPIQVPSIGPLSYNSGSHSPPLVTPIDYSDSLDDSPVCHQERRRRSIISNNSQNTAHSDDDSWQGSIPELLLYHPSNAVPSPNNTHGTTSSALPHRGKLPQDSGTLNMESTQEDSKFLILTPYYSRETSGNRYNISKTVGSKSKVLVESQSLPELLIKPIVELPPVRSTKSRLATNPSSPPSSNFRAGPQATTMNSPPLRTNSPSSIRQLQRPTSPVSRDEVKSLLHVQGSLASSASCLPNHADFVDSNSRYFAHIPLADSKAPALSTTSFVTTKTLAHTKVPWLPRGTLTPIDHDRSDLIEGWREKIELLRYQPFDTSKIPMTIKSQTAAKHAFEQYVKHLPQQSRTSQQSHKYK